MGNVSLKGFTSDHMIIIYWTYHAFLFIYSKWVACNANGYQILFCFKNIKIFTNTSKQIFYVEANNTRILMSWSNKNSFREENWGKTKQ